MNGNHKKNRILSLVYVPLMRIPYRLVKIKGYEMMAGFKYLYKRGSCEHLQDILVVWILLEDLIDPVIIQIDAADIVYQSTKPRDTGRLQNCLALQEIMSPVSKHMKNLVI